MAKHKKKRKTYVSKGERPNVTKSTLRLLKDKDNILNKLDAWKKGKRGFVTIKNPNINQTNRPYIKVSFESFFGGSYKDIKNRVKPAHENEG